MPLPVVTDGYLCKVTGTSAGKTWQNVFCVVAGGSIAASLVAQYVAEAWGKTSSICAIQTTGTAYLSCEATQLDGVSASAFNNFGTANHQSGTRALTDTNPAANLVVKLSTSNRGRSYRGRMYLSGLATTDYASIPTAWGSTFLSTATTSFGNFLSNLLASATPLTLSVLSRKLGVATAVSSFSCEAPIGTQRLRLRD